MRILLLGGTGFIGPHLVHAVLARGHHVSMLNRGRRAPNQNAGDFAKVEALRGDRSQPDTYASLASRPRARDSPRATSSCPPATS